MVSIKNTSTDYLHAAQNSTSKMSKIQKAIVTGNKNDFDNSCDIVVGNSYKTDYLQYSALVKMLSNATSLLDKAHTDLGVMSDIVMEMYELWNRASTQNFSLEELASFDTIFQNHINYLDQIATSSAYFSLHLLNGDMDVGSPRIISAPNGDAIAITLSDMRNSATPIANPGPNDAQIALSCTAAEFNAAIDIPVGRAVNVLANIKDFCGKDSFLYIIANQINTAFTKGAAAALGNKSRDCLAYLGRVDWNSLLAPQEALEVENLMSIVNFTADNGASTISANMNLIGLGARTMDEALLDTIQIAMQHYIPVQYITKASPILSIASPDYFKVVGSRLQSTLYYIVNAQASVNMQIQALEDRCDIYNMQANNYLDQANNYLKTDLILESAKLNRIIDANSFFTSIAQFNNHLENMISQCAQTLARNIH